MNRLKREYLESSPFKHTPRYFNDLEHTPYKGTSFLPDDYIYTPSKTNEPRQGVFSMDKARVEPTNNVAMLPRPFSSVNDSGRPIEKLSVLSMRADEKTKAQLDSGNRKEKLSVLSMRADETAKIKLGRESTNRTREDKAAQEREELARKAVSTRLQEPTKGKQPLKAKGNRMGRGTAAGAGKKRNNRSQVDTTEVVQQQPTTETETVKFDHGLSENEILEILEPISKKPFKDPKKERLSVLARSVRIERPARSQVIMKTHELMQKDKDRLRARVVQFYSDVGEPKSDPFIDNVMQHIQEFGIDGIQEKLRSKFGRGIDLDGKDAKEQMKSMRAQDPPRPESVSQLKQALRKFYQGRQEMSETDIDNIVRHIEEFGFEDFNQKLIDKYGVGIPDKSQDNALDRVVGTGEQSPQHKAKKGFFARVFRRKLGADDASETSATSAKPLTTVLRNIFSMRGTAISNSPHTRPNGSAVDTRKGSEWSREESQWEKSATQDRLAEIENDIERVKQVLQFASDGPVSEYEKKLQALEEEKQQLLSGNGTRAESLL